MSPADRTGDASPADGRLSKELKLFDVFAISTGAMFSSGFFLLPGLASAQAGPAVVLAYLLAGLLVVPAMLSKAELSTAMPRAGGTYYFLDRSLGPLVGAVGGLGTWSALILKSAFAIIGMGAYLTLFVEVPMTALAIALTLFFTLVNLVGAKETGRLQGILVVVLLAALLFFVVQGLVEVAALGGAEVGRQFTPFLPFGSEGLFATVGLVFVAAHGHRVLRRGGVRDGGRAGAGAAPLGPDARRHGGPGVLRLAAGHRGTPPDRCGGHRGVRLHGQCGDHVGLALPAGHGP